MQNKHIPVMLDEVKSFIPKDKKINVIDATFGGGGYSKTILKEFNINHLVAFDRDPIAKIFAKNLLNQFKNFTLINECFSKIDDLVINNSKIKDCKFDIIIFDLGLSSNQLEDSKRGFSFTNNGPLDMRMGNSSKTAFEIINHFPEDKLANLIFKYGDEKFSRKIAKNIVDARKIKFIESTIELSNLIKKSYSKNFNRKLKINPATKTFQALRLFVNDELKELSTALEKSIKLLRRDGKLIIVSFQSLEDRIVKDFFNHNSGKRWRSSRHLPELSDQGPITFEIITKKPIRPSELEISNNPRSRSAKLRVGKKIN